jgi:hypothetical protein
MKVVVIGGQSRNIGKTSLACGVIAGLPERNWTAVKITQFGHGLCAADGKPCDCATGDPEHPYGISRETDREGPQDTSRMLRAGAGTVYWLRALQGCLGEAMPLLLDRLTGVENLLVESNSVLDFLTPDVYVPVIDAAIVDYKASAQRLLPRADAFAVVGGRDDSGVKALPETPRFDVAPPDYCSPELIEFVRTSVDP